MKVRLLKDWGFSKAGDVVDVFEPTGRNWLLNGIAEEHSESRCVSVERATDGQIAERAVVAEKRRVAKRP